MRRTEALRSICERVPGRLRILQGRLLLDGYAEQMGAEEVKCPACDGTGRLEAHGPERCPICRGFEEVPRSLAEWFDEELSQALREAPNGTSRRSPAPALQGRVRYGRCAEVVWRISADDIPAGLLSA